MFLQMSPLYMYIQYNELTEQKEHEQHVLTLLLI